MSQLPPKRIFLTQGKFAIVDACDYEYLNQWKWCYSQGRPDENGYAVRGEYPSGKTIFMHRVILEQMSHKNFVRSDHINRDKLDNRRCNLRVATDHQSQYNKDRYKNNSSGYIGVSWHRQHKKWRAYIQINGKQKHLGYFDDIKKAARAYNKAALKHHGKFAVLNEV